MQDTFRPVYADQFLQKPLAVAMAALNDIELTIRWRAVAG